MRCAVVVPTFRREALLERLLGALTSQALPSAAYEVIVCDDARSEATRRQVERWSGTGDVRVRYECSARPRSGPAHARNVGWRSTMAPVIAFTDDDTIPSPDWLLRALDALMPGVDVVHGRVRVPLGERPTDHERDVARLDTGVFVTANCICRRDALRRVGGFDERFRTAWREDSELYFKLLDAGATVVYDPSVIVDHPPRPARLGECLRAEAKHRYDALLYKLHPRRFREEIGREAPAEYYAGVAAAGIGLAGLLAGSRGLAVAGLAAWAISTARVATRRLRGTSRRPAHLAEVAATSAVIPVLSLYWRARGAVEFRTGFL